MNLEPYHGATVTVLVLILQLVASTAVAQDQEEEEDEFLRNASQEELEALGWTVYEEGATAGSAEAGWWALTLGAIAHGEGHRRLGDIRAWRTLLVSEGIAAVLLATGYITRELSNDDAGLAVLYKPVIPLGASLFVTGWLVDVVGTMKGTEASYRETEPAGDSLSVSMAYDYLSAGGLPFGNALTMGLDMEFGPFFLHPEGTLGAELTVYGGVLGLRFGIGRRPESFVFVNAEATRNIIESAGFSYWSLVGSFGLSFDFGEIFPHLDGLVFRNEVGGGSQRYTFDFDSSDAVTATEFPLVSTSLGSNLFGDLFAEVGYLDRPDALVGHVSQSVGSFFGTLSYAITDRLSLFVDGRLGHGFRIQTGAEFALLH